MPTKVQEAGTALAIGGDLVYNALINLLGACPRCGGSFIREEDQYGAYLDCLACGYVFEFDFPTSQKLVEEENRRGRSRRRPYHRGKSHISM